MQSDNSSTQTGRSRRLEEVERILGGQTLIKAKAAAAGSHSFCLASASQASARAVTGASPARERRQDAPWLTNPRKLRMQLTAEIAGEFRTTPLNSARIAGRMAALIGVRTAAWHGERMARGMAPLLYVFISLAISIHSIIAFFVRIRRYHGYGC